MIRFVSLLVFFSTFFIYVVATDFSVVEEFDHESATSHTYISAFEACATQANARSRKRYFDGCNWCRCRTIGSARCTRKVCRVRHREHSSLARPDHVRNHHHGAKHDGHVDIDRYIPALEACTTPRDASSRKRYFDGCNWCRCKGIGEARCNTRICHLIQETVSVEKPGVSSYTPPDVACALVSDLEKFYFDGCNHCRCTGIGRAACSKLPCPEMQEYESAIRRPPTKPRPTRLRRQPKKQHFFEINQHGLHGRISSGSSMSMTPERMCSTISDARRRYYDGCNWCSCFGIGAAICTERFCPWLEALRPR
ncbi:uncharacterized protein LOC141899702 [Tubulanus polymorphus]|uniref:uncharacterized protein LOC141899702 n=1 Tax=Tubulanus polymorphus TaxID=672921 RepID=UPI003DA43133